MGLSRPRIGVTGPDHGGVLAWRFTQLAILRAGGWAIRVRPKRPREIHQLDGLVIGGGADISQETTEQTAPILGPGAPDFSLARQDDGWLTHWAKRLFSAALYWARRLGGRSRGRTDIDRDRLELSLLRAAYAHKIPVLGICRGAQLMNVSAGGTLHRDLTNFYAEQPNPYTAFPRKIVTVEPKSRLAAIVGTHTIKVNSLHEQAVDQVGEDLQAVGLEQPGVIQAIEHSHREFWIGVQWHPEYLPYVHEHQQIFDKLVNAAKHRLAMGPNPTPPAIEDRVGG